MKKLQKEKIAELLLAKYQGASWKESTIKKIPQMYTLQQADAHSCYVHRNIIIFDPESQKLKEAEFKDGVGAPGDYKISLEAYKSRIAEEDIILGYYVYTYYNYNYEYSQSTYYLFDKPVQGADFFKSFETTEKMKIKNIWKD